MKLKLCFLLLLCPFFGVHAQDKNLSVTSGSANNQGIAIGQQVPDVLIQNISGLNGSDKTPGALPLSAFKGKLLILDFWATWCSPCVAMIPKMEELQEEFKDRVQFLPVAYQSFKEVDAFYQKLQRQKGKVYSLPMVTADTTLARLFPHQSLPHYVWIGADGLVKAITGREAVSRENINALLAAGSVRLKAKVDEQMRYDTSEPLFFAGSDFNDGFFRSQLSGYVVNIGRGIYKDVEVQSGAKVRRITGRNLTVPELFRIAYKKGKKETVLEDGLEAELEPHVASIDFLDWLKQGRAYCYELMMDERSSGRAYALMQNQLKGFFSDYEVGLEARKVQALVLVRTSSMDKIRTAGGTPAVVMDRFGCKLTSCFLAVFIDRLQVPLQSSPLPVIDQTGYFGMVDLELTANMGSIEQVNKALAPYDLRFVEKPAEIEMLVIRKR
ncbi:thiol-disulfide isomerase/thioredoxin [Pedobacter sp. W3I1]|uniref:TlpA family protein disulfide reductase n=1 Tax=Pedobacter sp. W3I1 TaxID=3042291 RepID=UPI002789A740|nr:TlpA disulfide reductase family protein [Pedobacter sp. W3I1]MDQ0640075.1 thiol-disulfide isomerase/thioredoxin [Pedobacter sp. W3I1]